MNGNGNIRITFVLPFYNVEQYIVECLDSIYACPLSEDEYEVICVDDCSPDNSYDLVKEYSNCHNNLRVVKHDHNKRLGGGRNTGLANARGRYVWFIDTDDQVVPEKVQEVLNVAENNDLDVLSFNFCRFGRDGVEDRYDYHSSDMMSGPDYVGQIMGKRVITYNGFAWRHLYNTAFLREKGLRFPENVFWEDTVFVIDAIYRASRTMSVEDVAYRYRKNEASITFNPSAQACIDWCFKSGYEWYKFGVSVTDPIVSSTICKDANDRYLRYWLYWAVVSDKPYREDFVQKAAGKKEYPLFSYDKKFLSFKLLNRTCLRGIITIAKWLYGVKLYVKKRG